ncbi:uncharacterized protein [Panulirus ornatus]|uniref:uncharacterized protein n=1 Tax=Panulirus ornatus TaxID=150431 RepID=UPI003A8981E6
MSAVVMKSVQGGRGMAVTAVVNTGARHKHTRTPEQLQQQQQMHLAGTSPTVSRVTNIPMPPNVEELQASEKARFSPRRTRDVSAKLNQVGSLFGSGFMGNQGSQAGTFNSATHPVDSRIDVYDSSITVSLSSVMQTNVPKPFEITGKYPVHLNMPGGQWAQDDKYVSGDLHDHHHFAITSKKNPGTAHISLGSLEIRSPLRCFTVSRLSGLNRRGLMTWCGGGRLDYLNSLRLPTSSNNVCLFSNNVSACDRYLCTRGSVGCSRFFHKCAVCSTQDSQSSEGRSKENPKTQLTSRQKLQRAVKEYGTTVIVFHVAISLASLGICYLLVSSGVDMTGVIKSLGINIGKLTEGAVAGDGEVTATVDGTGGEAVGEATDKADLQQSDLTEVAQVHISAAESVSEGDVDLNTKRAAGAATFVVAYAVHKVFAPVRIATTLTATPFIVRYLRKVGFLKPPKLNKVKA